MDTAQRTQVEIKLEWLRIHKFDLDPYLVDVDSVEIHFQDGNARVHGVLDVPELRVPWIDIHNRNNCCKFPLVASSAVKVWTSPFDGTRVFISA